MNSVSWKILNVVFSGSFSETGLKKLETALFVVVAATLRLVGGGERSLSVEVDRFSVPGAIFGEGRHLCGLRGMGLGLLGWRGSLVKRDMWV